MRGNHYLSDVVGLLAGRRALLRRPRGPRLGGVGGRASSSPRWSTRCAPDGCDHEASISYHRLVTELFVCGTQAADALVPGLAPGLRSASGST